MNNKLIIPIIVVILLILGGSAFYLSSKNKNQTPTTNQPAMESSATPASAAQSLKDLITAGKSVKCEFKDTNESVSTEGTVYVANGKVRGDIGTTHMIVENQTSYIWMEGSTTGFKLAMDTSKQPTPSSSSNKGLDANKKMDYNCSPWTTDPNLFTLPANVKFSDLGSVNQTPAGSSSTNSKAAQCSACDSAPEAYRAQCKASLGC